MEYTDAIRGRRMVRSFDPRPVDPALVDRLLDDALRAPTAGNSRGTAWVVLQGAETAGYWDATTTAHWRRTSRRAGALSTAPVVAIALASPDVYVERYSEPDKAGSGLGDAGTGGRGAQGWPVPYWWGDAAFSVMALLLGAHDAGLGACFLGSFRGAAELRSTLGIPPAWQVFGTVLLGHPGDDDHRSASLERPGPGRDARIHHGRWSGGTV